ncbi:hypothetical protein [Nitrosomonas sp.]|uniref:hypothetical protein n=1 Tax=Nitrosomonas sp. TaxID=42353 RepID=UPI001DB670C6|nr:hypothetical protein [Nitrosomonas sp.]MBX3615650.1 hypothetical protein [Nitrosomonas sp.]
MIAFVALPSTSVNLYAFNPPEGYQGRFSVPRPPLLQPGITNSGIFISSLVIPVLLIFSPNELLAHLPHHAGNHTADHEIILMNVGSHKETY